MENTKTMVTVLKKPLKVEEIYDLKNSEGYIEVVVPLPLDVLIQHEDQELWEDLSKLVLGNKQLEDITCLVVGNDGPLTVLMSVKGNVTNYLEKVERKKAKEQEQAKQQIELSNEEVALLKEPYTLEEIIALKDEDGYIEAVIPVDLDHAFDHDDDNFWYELSEAIIGNYRLDDMSCSIVGTDGPMTLLLKFKGNVMEHLAKEGYIEELEEVEEN